MGYCKENIISVYFSTKNMRNFNKVLENKLYLCYIIYKKSEIL